VELFVLDWSALSFGPSRWSFWDRREYLSVDPGAPRARGHEQGRVAVEVGNGSASMGSRRRGRSQVQPALARNPLVGGGQV